METAELIRKLSDLVQLDINAVHIYEKAVEGVGDELLKGRLQEFRQAHRAHIETLSEAIRALGGQAPDRSPDLKGMLREALTAIRSATGPEGSLKAIKTCEETTHRRYLAMVSEDIPSDLKDTMRKHSSDEKVHLEYVDLNLKALS